MHRLLVLPNARLYLLGQTISLFGDTVLWLAMGIWVKSLTGSSSAAGLVFFVLSLPQLGAPFAGLLADRVRRRPLLIATNLATGAIVLLLLLVHDSSQVWLIYLVMLLYGASYTLLGPAQSALLTLILPGELLPDGNGALQTIRQGLRLISPLAGAGLFTLGGGTFVALIDAGTFLFAACTLAFISIQESAPQRSDNHWVQEVTGGIRYVIQTVVLRQLVIASALITILFGLSEAVAFAIVDQGLHRPPTFLGILISIEGIGAVVGAITAAPVMRRTSGGVLVGLGMILFAVGAPLLASTWLPVVLIGIVFFGFGLPWIIVGIYTVLQQVTPKTLQGRAYSALDLLIGVPQTIAIALGSALIAVVDYRLILLIMALVGALAAAYLLTRKAQRSPTVATSTQNDDDTINT